MGLAQTIIRRLTTPLLQVGGLAFDCEVQVQRGGSVNVTEYRIAAGASISDHSFDEPRTFVVAGAVSGIPQPQNLGRPGASLLGGLLDVGLQSLETLTGLNLSTRVSDFEARLEVLRTTREVVEIVSKVIGRKKAILIDWTCTTTADDGDMGMYQLTLREILTAGLTIADATEDALALNGTGGTGSPGGGGPSQSPGGNVEVSP